MSVEVASRKGMVSPEGMASWTHFRRDDGRPIRLEWGQPDADGWWSPAIIEEPCDHAFLTEGDYCAACGVGL